MRLNKTHELEIEADVPAGTAREAPDRQGLGRGRVEAFNQPAAATRAALLLNYSAALLIAVAYLAVVIWSAVSASEELEETALLDTQRWAETTLARSETLKHLMAGEAIDPNDRRFLRAVVNKGATLGFVIHGPDGSAVFWVPALKGLALAERAPADATLRSTVDIQRYDPDSGLPATVARVSIPITTSDGRTGSLQMLTDQSDADVLFHKEMYVTWGATSLLAALGLGNCIGVALLLRRNRKSDARILQLAERDSLTGLMNQASFLAALDRLLDRRGDTETVAVHIIDLDGFKTVNDAYGHAAGDRLLQMISNQLVAFSRRGDLLARLGEDEFAIAQKLDRGEEAEKFAHRLVALGRSIDEIDGVPINVGVSVGTALAPLHGSDPQQLRKYAGIALDRAKETGRGRHVVFEPGQEDAVLAESRLRAFVHSSVENRGFELHYQPIHRADGGGIAGFEALVRLPDRTRGGYVSPAEFIPVAEAMGLMPRIGAWVLKEACRTAATWPGNLFVAVNLSAQQFTEDVYKVVVDALLTSGISPGCLELEITESMLIVEEELVADQLRSLKEFGVRIVMDDFGTGYSSLAYLWKFPIDKLKVDRSFFAPQNAGEQTAALLRTIAAMGEAMRLTVVAEGIETEDQRALACRFGYDQLQGYLFARPMPRGEIPSYIETYGTPPLPQAGEAV